MVPDDLAPPPRAVRTVRGVVVFAGLGMLLGAVAGGTTCCGPRPAPADAPAYVAPASPSAPVTTTPAVDDPCANGACALPPPKPSPARPKR